MANAIVVLAVLGFIRSCHPSSTFWTKSSTVPFSKGNEDDAKASLSRTTSIACAVECHHRDWCNSLSYSPKNSTCNLYLLHYVNGDAMRDSDTTNYYRSYSKTCPVKDGFLLDRVSGLCMLVVTSPGVTAWQDAVRGCEEKGTRLVSLYTSSRLDFVISTLRHNTGFHGMEYFIGAKRTVWDGKWPGGEPDFRWLHDNAEVDTNATQYWNRGEPNNENNGDNVLVLAMVTDDFLLTDSPDTRFPASLSYICEK